MSDVPHQTVVAGAIDPDLLLHRAAAADRRARDALGGVIDDLAIAAHLRLDDRTRAMVSTLLVRMRQSVAGELRDYAARLLAARGALRSAAALRAAVLSEDRLPVDQPALIDECLARVRLELASAAMSPPSPEDRETPGLVVRLTRSPDRVVAAAATAYLTAESDRRAVREGAAVIAVGLPPALHRPLVWHVAADLRLATAASELAIDDALAAAARRNIAACVDDMRLEPAAMRLAQAIDTGGSDLADLIEEALRDGRLALLVALVAAATDLSFETLRGLIVEADDERLWLLLRALDLPRRTLARLGVALCEGDVRRDVEAFADILDAVMAIDPPTAAAAVAPLMLDPAYRAALLATGRR